MSNLIITRQERQALEALHCDGPMGPLELASELDVLVASARVFLRQLERRGLAAEISGRKYEITERGVDELHDPEGEVA